MPNSSFLRALPFHSKARVSISNLYCHNGRQKTETCVVAGVSYQVINAGYFDSIPAEIVQHITSFLDPVDKELLSITCKQFYNQLIDPHDIPLDLDVQSTGKVLSELLCGYMAPSVFAGNYGVSMFVTAESYKILRDDYWSRFPQSMDDYVKDEGLRRKFIMDHYSNLPESEMKEVMPFFLL